MMLSGSSWMTCLLSRLVGHESVRLSILCFCHPACCLGSPLITLISQAGFAELPVRDNFVVGTRLAMRKKQKNKLMNAHAYMYPSPDLACGPDTRPHIVMPSKADPRPGPTINWCMENYLAGSTLGLGRRHFAFALCRP